MLSDICLSVAYIGPKPKTEMPRNAKIGAEGANVTRDLDTTFKVTSHGAVAYCGGSHTAYPVRVPGL